MLSERLGAEELALLCACKRMLHRKALLAGLVEGVGSEYCHLLADTVERICRVEDAQMRPSGEMKESA